MASAPGDRMTASVLSVRDLCYATPEKTVFSHWSAEVGPGVTWIVGDEGTGKTTLLRLLAGRPPGSGRIEVRGRVAWFDPADERVDPVGVGEFFDRLRREEPDFDAAALAQHIAGFGLAPHLGKAFFQLSTGSRRKVGLAGSLASGAALTLLDDPTAALDGPSVAHLMRTLAACAADPARAWLVTAYQAPPAVSTTRVIRLP